MKFKLDENLGRRGLAVFVEAGHDALTVVDQQLMSASDPTLLDVCIAEQRCLVTLDLDFSNPMKFAPDSTSGIAVLRLTEPITAQSVMQACRTLIAALRDDSIDGKLWIVESGRVRKYDP
jgi:predicted nuclease of predicted toxin-antitoxin system